MIPLRKSPTDLKVLLSSALDGLEHQCEHTQVDLHVTGDDLAQVEIDPEKIAWAVATLVGNALRYVRHGSRNRPGGSIVVSLAKKGDQIEIAVSDDGPGIPADKVPYLFERKPGTLHAAGLALMLVHDVVVAHGGSVEVKSTTEVPDHGTRIALRLPTR
jgi:signal transduction histidine kinase